MFSELDLISQTVLQILIGWFNSTRMLQIFTASSWIFLLAVSSWPNDFGREIKNVDAVSSSSLLKKIADLWNRAPPPSFRIN